MRGIASKPKTEDKSLFMRMLFFPKVASLAYDTAD